MDSKVDKTIDSICNWIQEELKRENESDIPKIAELTKALADLITARANCEMYVRLHESGGSTANY